jgi:hypothetical protein
MEDNLAQWISFFISGVLAFYAGLLIMSNRRLSKIIKLQKQLLDNR